MFNCTIKMVNGEFLVISCNNWLPIDGVFQKAEGGQQPKGDKFLYSKANLKTLERVGW